MLSTVIARTRSGSCYILRLEPPGVRWYRVPQDGSVARAATGWQAGCPRVVPGERLLLGNLRTTPVMEVAFVPDSGLPFTDSRTSCSAPG